MNNNGSTIGTFNRENGYVSPLLSNLAADYSAKTREGLVAPLLFPRVLVTKPSGKYAEYAAEDAFKVPNVEMAGERSRAAEFNTSGTMKTYATNRYGIKSFIDEGDLQFMEGPFKLWEKRKTEMLVTKLELAQEKRVAEAVTSLSGRSVTLAGTGAGAGKKWSGASDTAGGDPAADIRDAIDKMFFRPNLMIIPEAVYSRYRVPPATFETAGRGEPYKEG
jgi:hypothetical protein